MSKLLLQTLYTKLLDLFFFLFFTKYEIAALIHMFVGLNIRKKGPGKKATQSLTNVWGNIIMQAIPQGFYLCQHTEAQVSRIHFGMCGEVLKTKLQLGYAKTFHFTFQQTNSSQVQILKEMVLGHPGIKIGEQINGEARNKAIRSSIQ